MRGILFALAALAAAVVSQPALAADIGVVFLHGKWGTTSAPAVKILIDAVTSAGFLVETPEMPWSRNRAYDKDVDGSLAEIDEAVARLKSRGAQRIVVGGQSLGANVALIYGSRRDGLAGIVTTAPGHTPDLSQVKDKIAPHVARAKNLVAEGKGARKERFDDINQGKVQQVTASAEIYASWMDPDGAAVIPKSAAALRPNTPLLWVVGDDDAMARRGEAYAFAKAPAHPKSAYKVVGGGHFDTPKGAATIVVDWLKGL